jgi:hypothetical protein
LVTSFTVRPVAHGHTGRRSFIPALASEGIGVRILAITGRAREHRNNAGAHRGDEAPRGGAGGQNSFKGGCFRQAVALL